MKLANERHELFAQHLAKGKSASQAYIAAGYQPCRQNASRLSAKADIQQRVQELREQPTRPIEINGRDAETGQFLQGVSGNPAGRPRGSRNLLGEKFIEDLQVEWRKSGATALKRVAESDPTAFVKVVAGVLPREIDAALSVNVDLFAEAKSFAQAFRMARDFIGAPLIEGECQNDVITVSDNDQS